MSEPNGYCTHCNDACPRCSDVPFDAEDAARERAAVVRYLRERGNPIGRTSERLAALWADDIERGEHLKETP
jgi:hypothetical protein